MSKTLRTLILDQKRESFVGEYVSQARKLQTAGDLASALSRVEEGLSTYPREMRLIQIRDAVQRDLHAQRRQTRRRDLEELRRLDSEASSASDPDTKRTLGARARALADKYIEDEEVVSSANGLLQKLNLPGVAGKSSGQNATSAATLSFAVPPTVNEPPQEPQKAPLKPSLHALLDASIEPATAAPVTSAPPTAPPITAVPAPPPETPSATALFSIPDVLPTYTPLNDSAKAATEPPSKKKATPAVRRPLSPNARVALAAGSVVVLLIIFIGLSLRRPKQPAPTPAPAQPEVAVQPVPAPTPAPIAPPEAVLPTMKLSSDTAQGKVSFDDQPATDLQDAQWALDKISSGDHTLKFDGPSGSCVIGLTSAAEGLPVVKTPISAKGLFIVVVSALGEHMHVYSSDAAAKLSFDGQPSVNFPAEGIDLPTVSTGAHELTVSHAGEEYKLAVEATPNPLLSAFIESGQNVGTLVVVTGQDKTKVFLNGKAIAQQTQSGQLRIANLEPKEYAVRVEKAGFQDAPEQKIRIRKGQQGRLVFGLLPVVHMASLSIQGGTPGTAVFIDQSNVGAVQSDGTLNLSAITPGEHAIELRKDRFTAKQVKKHFVAGTPVVLTGSEAAMEAAPGELKIVYTPADAQITLSKAGESSVKVSSGIPLSLSGGAYTLSARTADGLVRTSTLEVTAGQSRTLDLSLAPTGMSKWDDASGWKDEKGAFTRKGGDYVLYGVTPTSGTFVFSAMLTKGHRLQWVVNYTDPNNYDLFQIDDNNFYRTDVRNGQKTNDAKIPHKGEKKSYRTIQIRITPTEIIHQIRQGDAWVVLDRWTLPGNNLSSGRFGFYLPGGDQVSLANFGHYADLNIH